MEVGPEFSLPDDFMLERLIEGLMIGDSMGFMPPFFGNMLADRNNSKKKCEKTSALYYTKGKHALTENLNEEAVNAFTEALIAAPGSSKNVVTYYICRSIALKKLKAYPEALQDIERALKLSVTKEQKESIEKRRTAIESLSLTSDLQTLKIKETSGYEEDKLELSYGENEEIIGVSSAMALVYNNKFGRHYIATRDIQVGDCLMIQKPFVFAPIPRELSVLLGKKQWICDNCLTSTLNPIPCQSCTLNIYCTEECKLQAYEKYHKIECQVARKYPSNTEMLPLRSLIRATNKGEKIEEIYNVMENINNCKDKRTNGFSNGKLDGTKPEAILSLLTHTDKRRIGEQVINAALVADILRKDTDFFKVRNSFENVVKLGKLFLKLSYICLMNVYGIRGNNFDEKIALAMYPVFNYLNNSCANNALWYDQKNQKILRACKNIKKGEQVCVAYMTMQVIYKTAEERKHFFKEIKFFTCECEACNSNYSFKPELKRRLKISQQLKKKLINKPNDTKSLWELLRLVINEYKGPCLEGKRLEFALINAHLGSKNEEIPFVLRQLKLL